MEANSSAPIRIVLADQDPLYDHAFIIRTEVFVEEESVDQEDEYDGFDHLSHHYLAFYQDQAAGTARWRTMPSTGRIRLERFAVLKRFRKLGVGTALMEHILSQIPGQGEVFIHSQVENKAFFERFGFQISGEPFEEAGIQHFEMKLPADRKVL
ncbi:MAG: GNAT family N-acetyltransferase [Bacteroidota bacterium]